MTEPNVFCESIVAPKEATCENLSNEKLIIRSTSTYTGNHECILNECSSLLYFLDGYFSGLRMSVLAGALSVRVLSSLSLLWAEIISASGHLYGVLKSAAVLLSCAYSALTGR